jgi:xylulokinase
MEAVAYMLRRNLDLVAAGGIKACEIRNSGGGARSSLWNQIKADVCGIPVVNLGSEEAALLGNAILCAVACEEFDSIAQACATMVSLKRRVEPGINQEAYAELYLRYCNLDDHMDRFYRQDSQSRGGNL